MKQLRSVLIGTALGLGMMLTPAVAQHGHEGHEKAPTAAAEVPKCPVTGEPVNLAVSAETDDGPVFFCCKHCISKYQADPAKYRDQVAAQRKALADRPKVQVLCPVSREPVDQKVFIETGGEKVYFCCKGCIKKYQRDPAKYAAALANSYTYQTKCPVMGEDINPKAFSEAPGGNRIFYCCKGCEKKLYGNLQKYAPNLAAQGYVYDAKEMTHGEPHEDHDAHGHDDHDD